MVPFRATTGNQKLDILSFRLALIKGLTETHRSAVAWHGHGMVTLPLNLHQKRLTENHFLEKIPASGEKRTNRKCGVLCELDKRSKESPHTGAQTVKQGSVWKNASRSTTQNETSSQIPETQKTGLGTKMKKELRLNTMFQK
jgi:hypothetical protein